MNEKRFTYLNASRNKYIGSFFCNDIPLTNPEVLDFLNENEQLKEENKELRCTIEANSQEDYIDYLKRENEQLKLICQDHKDHAIDFKADSIRLEKENEQLKQYIYDNLDEDICEVCSHQYLENHPQMQGYYVAKCEKGYDNCSKGTVIHCKDFKFKELEING